MWLYWVQSKYTGKRIRVIAVPTSEGRAMPAKSECDCCGRLAHLTRCWTSCGIETFACAPCRGDDEEETEEVRAKGDITRR